MASHRASVLRLRDWTDAADRAAASRAWWRLERRASGWQPLGQMEAAGWALFQQVSLRAQPASELQPLDRMDAAGWAQLQQVRSHRECRASASQRLDQRDAAQWVVRIAHPVSPKPLSA